MDDALTYSIELLVGCACLVAGAAVGRRSKITGAVFVVMGFAAVGHALWAWIAG